MRRNIEKFILNDLKRKIVILSGPRQCGKTFLSRQLSTKESVYLNYDILDDRKIIIKRDWDITQKLVIFDEIHKMKKWKAWLKGIADQTQRKYDILVTGSAKINTYKKVGDSLAGRYFYYRLYPLDLKEIRQNDRLNLKATSAKQNLERLLSVSGFPEPYLANDVGYYRRWQQTHLDIILRQDILETESVRNIKQIETLTLLLTERVGSLLSYNSLREDLSTDDKSIKRWIDILENSYVVFRIYPFVHKSLTRGLKKAPKLYFFDIGRVTDPANRIENLVALSLLKEIHLRMDTLGEIFDLHFLQNKQKNEIDFILTKDRKPYMMIEVKESDTQASANFAYFEKALPGLKKVQLVKNLIQTRRTAQGVLITPLADWLEKMDF